MYKLLFFTIFLWSGCLMVPAQENLLSNPDGSGGTRHWKVFGEVSADSRFEVRKGHAIQIVKLDGAVGKFILLIANAGTEKFKTNRTLTGFPGLGGYLLSTYNPHGVNEITTYLNAGSPKGMPTASEELVTIYGIFEVPESTVAAQVTINRASRDGEDDDGSAAIFERVGLYLFDTREEAIAFAKKY